MVSEFFQNFWKSFGVLFSKTGEKLVLKEKSRACLPNTPLSKNRGTKNTLRLCLANTALIIKKHFSSLVKLDMPNTLLCLEKAHPSHVGWASWPKAQTQKTWSRNRNKEMKIKRGFLLEIDEEQKEHSGRTYKHGFKFELELTKSKA